MKSMHILLNDTSPGHTAFYEAAKLYSIIVTIAADVAFYFYLFCAIHALIWPKSLLNMPLQRRFFKVF